MRVHRLPLRIHSIRNSALVGNAPLARALALTLAVSRSSCYTCTMARLEYFATRANVNGLSSRIGLASSNPKPSFVLLEGYLNNVKLINHPLHPFFNFLFICYSHYRTPACGINTRWNKQQSLLKSPTPLISSHPAKN